MALDDEDDDDDDEGDDDGSNTCNKSWFTWFEVFSDEL